MTAFATDTDTVPFFKISGKKPFTLEGNTISTFQGCSLYYLIGNIISEKGMLMPDGQDMQKTTDPWVRLFSPNRANSSWTVGAILPRFA